MRVLVLSAYHARSHDYWLQGLRSHLPEVDWKVLTLPPRYFNWRIRGNALSWFSASLETLSAPVDLVLATSTVDVATLRGMVPALRQCPWVVYFHENQFAYPDSPHHPRQAPIEPQMVNLYAALAADQLWFNSRYNFDTLIAGCEALCRKLPDAVPPIGWFEQLAEKSRILPVPLDESMTAEPQARRANDTSLRMVWNHRWEYDKGVEQLEAALTAIEKAGLPIELTLLGQRFRKIPPAMQRLLERPMDGSVRVVDAGYIEDAEPYRRLLGKHSIVLSTALHDFQGLAVMEAVQSGCVPLLPDRLCYPEFFAGPYLYRSSPADVQMEAEALVEQLTVWQCSGLPAVPSLQTLGWSSLEPAYRRALEQAASNILPSESVS